MHRANIFSVENEFPKDKIAILPNSSIGKARRKTNNYWFKKFNISNKKIVLYAGSASPVMGVKEIIESVKFWPEDWVLIIHVSDPREVEYIKDLERSLFFNNVLTSFQVVSYDEYRILIDGADVGITYYNPDKDGRLCRTNFKEVGYSSGKIADYLQAGLPIIVSPYTSLCNTVTNYFIGKCVNEPSEIGLALKQIIEEYNTYSQNAITFFSSYLDFDNYYPRIKSIIEILSDK